MNAKVAIVTRTKNRPVLLRRALSSILGQSMRDFSLIVVNDAPEREPVEKLIEEFSEQAAGRIVLIHNERAAGRWGAMNAGIDAAESEYFVLHDDDDAWHPDFLARTTEYLDSHPDDAAVGTRTDLVYETIEDGAVTELRRTKFATELTAVSLTETLKQNYVPPIALLLRRRVFDEIGRFDNTLPVLADWDFNLRLLSRYTVGFIDGESLAYWHHRESSTGDDGNSVIADAANHQRHNLLIRDKYLRQGIDSGSGLGSSLLAAELFRQLDRKADLAREESSRVAEAFRVSNADHLQSIHADILAELVRTSEKIDRLRDEVDEVRRVILEESNRSGLRKIFGGGRAD
jgi:glycosyltransferase involved in cell wall biosynthesis